MADASDLRQVFSNQLNKAAMSQSVPQMLPTYASTLPPQVQYPVQVPAPAPVAPPAPVDQGTVSQFDPNSFFQKHWLKVVIVVVLVLGLFCAWYVFVHRANKVPQAQPADDEQKKAAMWARYQQQQQQMMHRQAQQQPPPPSVPLVQTVPGAQPPPPPPKDARQAMAQSVHAESEMRAGLMQNRPQPQEAGLTAMPPPNAPGTAVNDPHFTPLPA